MAEIYRFYFMPLFLRACLKELGDAFRCRGNFHFLLYCTNLKPVHSEYQSAPVTIQAMLLEMFIELPKMVKHEIKLKYLSWSLRVGKELDTFAFVIDISEPHIFSSIQEGTRPTSFRRRSLIPSLSIFLALFHCFYLNCLLTD